MSKRFWLILLLLITGFIGFAWYETNNKADETGATGNITPPTHIVGKQESAVSLVEYSDFQCPACAAYYPVVEQIIEKYKDRISFEYRQYPLISIHRNAFAASRASEAADKQGKFWEMYRLLFTNQQSWAESGTAQSLFEDYARQLSLDLTRFKTDFASSETNTAINASIKEFNKRGLPKSTPTFLLNGKKIQVRNTVEEFSKLIDAQLELAN